VPGGRGARVAVAVDIEQTPLNGVRMDPIVDVVAVVVVVVQAPTPIVVDSVASVIGARIDVGVTVVAVLSCVETIPIGVYGVFVVLDRIGLVGASEREGEQGAQGTRAGRAPSSRGEGPTGGPRRIRRSAGRSGAHGPTAASSDLVRPAVTRRVLARRSGPGDL
jgi:hypothetical protein